MRRLVIPAGLILALLAHSPASAASCTREDFAVAVDRAGAALRKLNADNQPRLRAKMSELKVARGWPDAGFEEKAYELLQDERMAALDAQANDLLAKLDALGTPDPSGEPDCAKLQELTASSLELQATVKTKAAYTLAKLDQMLKGDPTVAPAEPKAKRGSAQGQGRRGAQGATAASACRRRRRDRRKSRAGRRAPRASPRARWRSRLRPAGTRAAASAARRRGARGGGLHHRRDHGGERGVLRQGVGQSRRRHRVSLQEQRPSLRLRPGHRRRRGVPGRRALRQRHPLHARRRQRRRRRSTGTGPRSARTSAPPARRRCS